LTLAMDKERGSPDPEQLKQFKRLLLLSGVALVVIWSLVWASFSHGAVKAVGLAVGTPVLIVLFVVALRMRRET